VTTPEGPGNCLGLGDGKYFVVITPPLLGVFGRVAVTGVFFIGCGPLRGVTTIGLGLPVDAGVGCLFPVPPGVCRRNGDGEAACCLTIPGVVDVDLSPDRGLAVAGVFWPYPDPVLLFGGIGGFLADLIPSALD
jgi:hypothetical protein